MTPLISTCQLTLPLLNDLPSVYSFSLKRIWLIEIHFSTEIETWLLKFCWKAVLKSTFCKSQQKRAAIWKQKCIQKNTVFIICIKLFLPLFWFSLALWKDFGSCIKWMRHVGKWTWVIECTLVNPYVIAIEGFNISLENFRVW